MYTTSRTEKNDTIKVEAPKQRAKALHDVLSGRKGGRMQDKRKSRASQKHAARRDYQ